MEPPATIPVVLFAYRRADCLDRTLAGLRAAGVRRLIVFADGAKGTDPAEVAGVATVRAQVRAIDWCEVKVVERSVNLGLGANVLSGLDEVAAEHAAFVVMEDDLVLRPGAYAWMCAALRHYADDARVMSVAAWTHPRVTPSDIGAEPYFDGRAECWGWGTWARAWRGMTERTARDRLGRLAGRADEFGGDLPVMARAEAARNLWAVRWIYHLQEQDGLCLRPPWTWVEHIGFDSTATNAAEATEWINPPIQPEPPLPEKWPEPELHPACAGLWRQAMAGHRPLARGLRWGRRALHAVTRPAWRRAVCERLVGIHWRGDYANWAAAAARATGYDQPAILERVSRATAQARANPAFFERDGVVLPRPAPEWPPGDRLEARARSQGGRLGVVDFGGALGSLYFQERSRWDAVGDVVWRVVEQEHFVSRGRAAFADGRLEFRPEAAEAFADGRCDVLLLSGVLQCLPEPHAMLAELLAWEPRVVVLDRAPLIARATDRLTLQTVPRSLGEARYPCWFFNRERLLGAFADRYTLVEEHGAVDGGAGGADFRGFYFELRA